MDVAWYITPDDLEAIEIGANVLGTGGGGNPYTIKLYARELLKQGKRIAVVDPLTLPDDALVAAVGGMGAPTVSIERICILERDTTTPINTELLRYGFRVVVVGFSAPAPLTSAQALQVVGPQAFGYDVPYRPLVPSPAGREQGT